MKTFSILVVDDDSDFLNGIIRHLKKQFHTFDILGVPSGEAALSVFQDHEIGVMLSDLRMPGISGHTLLTKALNLNPYVCVIMITGFATVENAVQCLKTGAWDFITKPVERQALFHTVERAVQHYALARENQHLKFLVSGLEPENRQWESRAMNQIQEKIKAMAVTDYTVLVTGESGSGKEFVAREIHRLSRRSAAACHVLNCPAIPEPLLESELFGHVKGAFTGAERNRDGFFMAADKGTLILDEIGDISLPIQAKLLKFLQDKEVKPVGSSRSKTADVRIIALTNQDLNARIRDKTFREDLYYRLHVLSVYVPPLRERREDIPMLVRHFMSRTCKEMHMKPMDIEPPALAWMTRQPWPGNVRELLNMVRRLVVFSNGGPIDSTLIRLVTSPADGQIKAPDEPVPYKIAKKQALDIFSRTYLTRLFEHTHGNISETARISGLERASIQKIIRRLNLDVSRFRR
ncbi:MAG: sigma-54-dependent transcriptional regulator [Thermodesulfobacteriota bacterium]